MDNIFFEGLKVGKVTALKKMPDMQEATIEPYANVISQTHFLIYTKKIEEPILKEEEVEERLKLINDIDLTKYGWVKKVSERLNISHTQVRRFIKEHYDGDFYSRK